MSRFFKVFVVAQAICYALASETLRRQDARRFLLPPEVLSRTGTRSAPQWRLAASRDCDGATGSFIAK
jgi:hypothetical protein